MIEILTDETATRSELNPRTASLGDRKKTEKMKPFSKNMLGKVRLLVSLATTISKSGFVNLDTIAL